MTLEELIAEREQMRQKLKIYVGFDGVVLNGKERDFIQTQNRLSELDRIICSWPVENSERANGHS